MTNSELMLRAITDGLTDDGTTAAALDAIREESGCTLLVAVLEVARVHQSVRAAREMVEATRHLAENSPISSELRGCIIDSALNPVDGALVTVVVIDGDQWPTTADNSLDSGSCTILLASITVGALWVLRAAETIQQLRKRRAEARRRRRSR